MLSPPNLTFLAKPFRTQALLHTIRHISHKALSGHLPTGRVQSDSLSVKLPLLCNRRDHTSTDRQRSARTWTCWLKLGRARCAESLHDPQRLAATWPAEVQSRASLFCRPARYCGLVVNRCMCPRQCNKASVLCRPAILSPQLPDTTCPPAGQQGLSCPVGSLPPHSPNGTNATEAATPLAATPRRPRYRRAS